MRRRTFLRNTGILATAASAGLPAIPASADPCEESAGRILARVRPPRFPNRTFPVTDFGARGDGTTDCTAAIVEAIWRCNRAGGGHVLVPDGAFLTGAIHLRSNVDLHLSAGATLKFSQDPAAYLPAVFTRWQGIELMNYSAFIYAFGQENIAISGAGTLDGQADATHWWPWKTTQDPDWQVLQQQADAGVPVAQRVFGGGHLLRPNLIQTYRCRNVLIDGVTIINSPMWEIHPVLSSNVTVRGITVNSHGPNNDGCDPESCQDVVIRQSTFNTGDDCIAIKSGRNTDGRRVNVPSENIVIMDCDFADGHGGVTIGSEMTGGVRNVFAQNLRMSSPNLNNVLRLKTNSLRGGFIENVHMRQAQVGQVAQIAVLIDFFYEDGPGHGFNPTAGGIHVSDLTVNQAKQPWYLVGYPDDHIGAVSLTDCSFAGTTTAPVAQDIDGLTLSGVTVNGAPFPG